MPLPQLTTETHEAIQWIAAEYDNLRKLQDRLQVLEESSSVRDEFRAYRQAWSAYRYVRQAHRRAERHLAHLEKAIKDFPELVTLGTKIQVSEGQLLKSFSFYAGRFRDDLERLLRTIALQRWRERRKKTDLLTQSHEQITAIVADVREKVTVLATWTHALQLQLRQLERTEAELTRREVLHRGARMAAGGAGLALGGLLGLFPRRAAATLYIKEDISPRNSKRAGKDSTEFIVLHTTEGSGSSSLAKLRRNGEAHYMVDTDGTVYKIIDEDRIAKHAGRSMWDNKRNLDNYSIGIEVVGYHKQDLTAAQYASLTELLYRLKKKYGISDKKVLTHSMVAYGVPNKWHRKSHRGRKRCGMQMATPTVRQRLGLRSKPSHDPDMNAGRLVNADPYLAGILFGNLNLFPAGPGKAVPSSPAPLPPSIPAPPAVATLPTQPPGTEEEGFEGFKEIGKDGNTAYSIAGDEYGARTTIYFFTFGMYKPVRTGEELLTKHETFNLREKDGDIIPIDGETLLLKQLPVGTKVLVGYVYGGHVKETRTAYSICGKQWNYPSTFYRFPNGVIQSGDELDSDSIPADTLVFFRN